MIGPSLGFASVLLLMPQADQNDYKVIILHYILNCVQKFDEHPHQSVAPQARSQAVLE